jgi:hypothetical protein
MAEIKISRYFAVEGDPTNAALTVMLQRWRESGVKIEPAAEYESELNFGKYLVQNYDMFCQIKKLLEEQHKEGS